ncbi:aegerolysin family protein [Pantoea dispersa]|uniref:aegerolysin family protein n=1 Tax=Pantoea dispersa TaxID=59814 RepID=UPI00321319B1
MAENINITCNIKNETGNQLSVTDSNLSWGKWQSSPGQISADTVGSYKASGRKDSSSGTEGYVTYTAFDGTTFTFNFSINWGTEANSVSNSAGGTNPTNFTFIRTQSDYATPETGGDPGSSPVTVYYVIQKNG